MLYKEYRLEAGLTQKQLAEILCVSQNAIHQWETGKREAPMDIIIKLANYYDVSLDKFCERKWDNLPEGIKKRN